MPSSNADKQLHGQSAQDSLEFILQRCFDLGYLTEVESPYRIGKEGYSNASQFYAPFLITFADGTQWALFTTTSMRTDRIKGQQWDAINLKEINDTISQIYLVYPDGVSEDIRAEFIRQNRKYANNSEYSAIDGIVSQDQISNAIERYALRNLTPGQLRDAIGNNFENRIATILSYPGNFLKWKTGNANREGMHYDTFMAIVECIGLDKATTDFIEATSDINVIGLLPSGGKPKTDVLIRVVNTDGQEAFFTISCKRSSEQSVSVHQYSADSFADVLDGDNTELRELLNLFQRCGNRRDMGEDNINRLTLAIAPYIERLSMWVLGGRGGAGNPVTQWADFIVTYDNNDGSTSVHTINDYYQLLIHAGNNGMFGTPFSWTYQGARGTNIQLKCKIIK